jgi:hypothetical protein
VNGASSTFCGVSEAVYLIFWYFADVIVPETSGGIEEESSVFSAYVSNK